jgi:hypothetical protein
MTIEKRIEFSRDWGQVELQQIWMPGCYQQRLSEALKKLHRNAKINCEKEGLCLVFAESLKTTTRHKPHQLHTAMRG